VAGIGNGFAERNGERSGFGGYSKKSGIGNRFAQSSRKRSGLGRDSKSGIGNGFAERNGKRSGFERYSESDVDNVFAGRNRNRDCGDGRVGCGAGLGSVGGAKSGHLVGLATKKEGS
jgi:hypothetical protein